MVKSLLAAFGLMLVFEGIMPFVSPRRWRHTLLLLMSRSDLFARGMGFSAMVAGLILVMLVHHFL